MTSFNDHNATVIIQNNTETTTAETFWKYEILDNDYYLKVQETVKYDPNNPGVSKNTIIELPDPLMAHGREIIIEDTGGNAHHRPIFVQWIDKYDDSGEPKTISVHVINENYGKIKLIADGSAINAEKGWNIVNLSTPQFGAYAFTGGRKTVIFDASGDSKPGGGLIIHDSADCQFYDVIVKGEGPALSFYLTFPHPVTTNGRQFYVFDKSLTAEVCKINIAWRDRKYDKTNNAGPLYIIKTLDTKGSLISFFSIGDTYMVNGVSLSLGSEVIHDPVRVMEYKTYNLHDGYQHDVPTACTIKHDND